MTPPPARPRRSCDPGVAGFRSGSFRRPVSQLEGLAVAGWAAGNIRLQRVLFRRHGMRLRC